MKQILSTVLVSTALLTGTFAYSRDAKPATTTMRVIPITSAFQKIEAGNNIQLVLIQDAYRSTVVIKGDANFIPAVNVNIDKGVLSITSKKNLKGRKIKIYVPITTLSSLKLAYDASATTEGTVKLDDLMVIVQDGGAVNLHVIGNVHVEPVTGCDFVYETYEKSKIEDDQQDQ
jgi:Putative auto-transporter adhesin, head GIN domain